MKLQDLIIDKRSLGKQLLLVDAKPCYVYANGVRTNEVSGYTYDIALPERHFDHISIKIPGPLQLELGNDDYVDVVFEGLELGIAWSSNGYYPSGTATAITRKTKTSN